MVTPCAAANSIGYRSSPRGDPTTLSRSCIKVWQSG